ncbi:MAG: DUF935 family protein [Bacteroidales bacterium]|nr:DUF935 family protein [Bacteroidales bacterium]
MKKKKTFRPQAAAPQTQSSPSSDIILKLAQEFQDRSRKDIQKWRDAITSAENPENPRWYMLQDMIEDLMLDAHLSSVVDVRKMATLNHKFYVTDVISKETLEEQTEFLNKQWFYEFLEFVIDAIFRKYSLLQIYRNGEVPQISLIPHRNVCIQKKRVYTEVAGDNYIDYSKLTDVIEIIHTSKFGLINTVAPNVIWKRNLMQSNAEFSERFGMPLITATTANKADVPRIDKALKNLGEAGTGVLPKGSEIQVHALANAGNPEKVYLDPAKFHDNQVSKCVLGSTTIVDEGANRAQTEIHESTLDYKISATDKRTVMFIIKDQLFPILQTLGFPFDNAKMNFQFDENEDLSLQEQWKITSEALQHYDLDEKEVMKTFNLPITGKKQTTGFSGNFQ